MEWIANCPKCGKRNIIDSKHEIKPVNGRFQRMTRCTYCKLPKRMTIIGKVVKRFKKRSALVIRWLK